MHITRSTPVVAIVEDDEMVRRLLAHCVAAEGYAPREVATGMELRTLVGDNAIDAVLLDLNLGDEDGLTLLKSVRNHTSMPVVVVSARGDDQSRIRAFELGADDFVAKPFNARELVLRLQRRMASSHGVARATSAGGLHIDEESRIARDRNGTPIALTPAEFDLVAQLVRTAGKPVSRARLAEVIGKRESSSSEVVTVLIHRLRRKLAKFHEIEIVTVPLLGYRLTVNDDADSR